MRVVHGQTSINDLFRPRFVKDRTCHPASVNGKPNEFEKISVFISRLQGCNALGHPVHVLFTSLCNHSFRCCNCASCWFTPFTKTVKPGHMQLGFFGSSWHDLVDDEFWFPHVSAQALVPLTIADLRPTFAMAQVSCEVCFQTFGGRFSLTCVGLAQVASTFK